MKLTEPLAILSPVSVEVHLSWLLSSLEDEPPSRVCLHVTPDGYWTRRIKRSDVIDPGLSMLLRYLRTIYKLLYSQRSSL